MESNYGEGGVGISPRTVAGAISEKESRVFRVWVLISLLNDIHALLK